MLEMETTAANVYVDDTEQLREDIGKRGEQEEAGLRRGFSKPMCFEPTGSPLYKGGIAVGKAGHQF